MADVTEYMKMTILNSIVLLTQFATIYSQCDADKAFGCVGTLVNFSVTIRGYKALSGPNSSFISSNIVRNKYPHCGASFSCYGASFIIPPPGYKQLECRGTRSCSNVANFQLYVSPHCNGALACANSNISSHPNWTVISDNHPVAGYGEKSLAYSRITGRNVRGSGAFSLYKSIIDSNDNRENGIHVTLEGYFAGFGAQLICRESDVCVINCNGNACAHFYGLCLGECIVNTQSSITTNPILMYNETRFNEAIQSAPSLAMIPPLIDTAITTMTNNQRCDSQNPTFVFDDYRQSRVNITGGVDETGPLCGRASQSLYTSQINYYGDLVLSGASSAQSGSVIYAHHADIYASGDSAILGWSDDVYIYNADNIYVSGRSGMRYGTVVTGSRNVICAASISCSDDSKIISNGTDLNVFAMGWNSVGGLTVYCNTTDLCNVHCLSSQSGCDEMIIECDGQCNVQCDVDTGCPAGYNENNVILPKYVKSVDPSHPTSNPTTIPTSNPVIITFDPTIAPTIEKKVPQPSNSTHNHVSTAYSSLNPTEPPIMVTTYHSQTAVNADDAMTTQLYSNRWKDPDMSGGDSLAVVLLIMIGIIVCVIGIVLVYVFCYYWRNARRKSTVEAQETVASQSMVESLDVDWNQSTVVEEDVQPGENRSGEGNNMVDMTIEGEGNKNSKAHVTIGNNTDGDIEENIAPDEFIVSGDEDYDGADGIITKRSPC